MKFAVLGLGDSSYARFMAVPRFVRRGLAACGGEEFHVAGEADAAGDQEGQVRQASGVGSSARMLFGAFGAARSFMSRARLTQPAIRRGRCGEVYLV